MIGAVSQASSGVDWFTLIVGVVGGLALFLYGMDRMTESLRVLLGDRARRLLGRLTANRFSGLLTGAGITAIVQSSSAVTDCSTLTGSSDPSGVTVTKARQLSGLNLQLSLVASS